MQTYDWRLATHRATRRPPGRTSSSSKSTSSPSGTSSRYAGRWPWPRVDPRHPPRLSGARAAEGHRLRRQFRGPATPRCCSVRRRHDGPAPSPIRNLSEAVKNAGNVILLADATYEGEQPTSPPELPDAGYRARRCRRDVERQVMFPPFPELARGGRRGSDTTSFVLDSDGPLRHIVPFVRTNQRVLCRRSASPPRCGRRAFAPERRAPRRRRV